ncbi:MAG: hypothetical protein F6K11_14625 [Leptolyngbya sp. SIO3F4]|nr:hypothetical protein [Leptolyngbya sp. SIO3F4]
MRLPPSVRYLPSRLQFALNPWLWLGILLTGIVGLYAWEYRQNPGKLPWQIGQTGLGASGNSTSTDVLLESLTPEEQAVAAELDNVELLLAQLDSDVSALTIGGDSGAAASLNESADDVSGVTTESSVERLNRYIDEYSFLGTGARGSNFQADNPQVITPVQRQTESVLNLRREPEPAPTTSVLGNTFVQQQLEVSTSNSQVDVSLRETGSSGVDSRGLPTSESPADDSGTGDQTTNEAPNQAAFSFGQFDQTGVIPGSLNGLNRSFIRTTPSMSPPPGTTGYVPPASLSDFNRLNQQPSGASPFASQSGAGSLGVTVPSTGNSDNSQVLPPASIDGATPLETPGFNNSPQNNQSQPRNAWESFWD